MVLGIGGTEEPKPVELVVRVELTKKQCLLVTGNLGAKLPRHMANLYDPTNQIVAFDICSIKEGRKNKK